MNCTTLLKAGLACALTLGGASVASTVFAAQHDSTMTMIPPQKTTADAVSGHSDNAAHIAREQRITADWTRLTSLPYTATRNTVNVDGATTDPAPHATQADSATTAYFARGQRIMADWTRLTSIPDAVTTAKTRGGSAPGMASTTTPSQSSGSTGVLVETGEATPCSVGC